MGTTHMDNVANLGLLLVLPSQMNALRRVVHYGDDYYLLYRHGCLLVL